MAPRKTNDRCKTEDRDLQLQNEWDGIMPCSDCDLRDICKYAKSFKRPDFNPDVFKVAVTCTIKPKVYARFEDNSMIDDGK